MANNHIAVETVDRVDPIELARYNDMYECCCISDRRTDRRLLAYIFQIITVIGIIVFCCVQLMVLVDCPSQQSYIAMLTLMIGVLLPNPTVGGLARPTSQNANPTPHQSP